MLPVIAIVGRPNVGKSTLFNCITKTRQALVADFPGLTRDRQYGEGSFNEKRFVVVDTGGINIEEQGIPGLTLDQTRHALEEADVILFMVDARAGLTGADQTIASQIRALQKPVYLVVNKIDGIDPAVAMAEFYTLGFKEEPITIAASHNRGIDDLLESISIHLPEVPKPPEEDEFRTKFAIVGRPNAGKSTLVNRILGEDRVIVSEEAGTTRDSIYIPFTRHNKEYLMIDTAGVRKRGKVSETIEKFSIIKTLQAVEAANVVIFMVNAQEGLVEHELKLIGFILESGRALVIAINKWDGLVEDQKNTVKRELSRRLIFVDYVDIHFISALHGTNVGNLFDSIDTAYAAATKPISTNDLTTALLDAVKASQPPMSHGHRIKLRYAHLGGHNPPTIIIHGNQTDALPESYRRYLSNSFRKTFNLRGTPVHLYFKTADNPFKDKKNVLTDRQKKKRKRLFSHYKKK